MQTLINYLAVAAGGALGACLRYFLGASVLSRTAQPFPTATFVINVTGSFILGFFLTLATERIQISPHVRLAVAVGFVGAYTTFSTFEYETARLVEERDLLYAFLNVVLSFAVGFAFVWAGIIAARKLEGVPMTSSASYTRVEAQADANVPAQMGGAERNIRDSSIQANAKKKENVSPSEERKTR